MCDTLSLQEQERHQTGAEAEGSEPIERFSYGIKGPGATTGAEDTIEGPCKGRIQHRGRGGAPKVWEESEGLC